MNKYEQLEKRIAELEKVVRTMREGRDFSFVEMLRRLLS
jgi:hypothetical protein